MDKKYTLYGATGCVVVAALCGTAGLAAGAFSFGLASMGLFFISTQFKG